MGYIYLVNFVDGYMHEYDYMFGAFLSEELAKKYLKDIDVKRFFTEVCSLNPDYIIEDNSYDKSERVIGIAWEEYESEEDLAYVYFRIDKVPLLE